MNITALAIPDVKSTPPKVNGDDSDYFVKIFSKSTLKQVLACSVSFCRDNESTFTKGVLHGLHFQPPPFLQANLVRVAQDEVLDVAVDIRPDGSTFCLHVSAVLGGENKHQLLIPYGFSHGFMVLSETAVFSCKVDNYYSFENDRGRAYNDSKLATYWILTEKAIQLSAKDKKQPGSEKITTECSPFNYRYG